VACRPSSLEAAVSAPSSAGSPRRSRPAETDGSLAFMAVWSRIAESACGSGPPTHTGGVGAARGNSGERIQHPTSDAQSRGAGGPGASSRTAWNRGGPRLFLFAQRFFAAGFLAKVDRAAAVRLCRRRDACLSLRSRGAQARGIGRPALPARVLRDDRRGRAMAPIGTLLRG
jgi:hypothetical protein